MPDIQSKSRRARLIALYGFAFLALFVFLLWKCSFGYANMDEAFYLTVPYRMCRGDRLLLHEWNLSQLTGVLLYPAVRLFLLIHGGTDHILLSFRCLFTAVWALGAVFLFLRLKDFSLPGSMLASLAFLIYTPFGIMALSYNSLGILLFVSSLTIAVSARTRPGIQFLAAGVLFAGAVLCCPYLVLVYLLMTAACLCAALGKRKRALALWLWFSLGCGALLAVFCAFVFSKETGIREILTTLPFLLEDPEHPKISLGESLRAYLSSIYHCSGLFPACFAVSVVLLALPFLTGHVMPCFAASCLVCVVLQISILRELPYLNFVMFPLNMAVPFCALHCKTRAVRLPFFGIWAPGGLYTLCSFLASNQKFFVISSVSTIMTVAGIVMLCASVPYLQAREQNRRGTWAALLALALLLGVQLSAETALRYSSVFWEPGGMSAQTLTAAAGPERGIRMTPERLEQYSAMADDVSVIRSREGVQKILFVSENTVLYLMAEKDFSTYSAWLGRGSRHSIDRLDTYFSLFPDKLPDGIYLDASFSKYLDRFLWQGYRTERLPSGAFFITKGETV